MLQGGADLFHQVVRAPALDAGTRRADEPTLQMSIHHFHDGVTSDALPHVDDLQHPMLSVLADFPHLVSTYVKGGVLNLLLQLGYHFLAMSQEVASLAALLSAGATQYLVEGIRHIAVVDDFLYDESFSMQSCLILRCSAFRGFYHKGIPKAEHLY